MCEKENWKDINGFKCYQISNLGNVKSFKKHKYGKILKLLTDSRGYYVINLCNNGMYQKLVHRLVAEHFLDAVEGQYIVNHKDLNKLNNCVDNLEWCTTRHNVSHYYKNIDCYSNYTGVSKVNDKFRAAIEIENKKYNLGCYADEKVAAYAYKKALSVYNSEGKESFINYLSELLDIKSSKYKGVSYDKSRGKWRADAKHNGNTIISKRCDTEDEAVMLVIQSYVDNNKPLHRTHKKYLENKLGK